MYNSQGELSNGVHSILTGTISANSVTTIPVNQSSPGLDVAHCLLRGEGLSATLSYDYVDGRSSPCHVPASKSFGSKWRIFPGNWDFVFDGLAIVNYDTARSEICISQMDYDGNVIQTEQLATDLPFKAKTKYVIGGPDGSSFEGIDDTYFEVVADTNLGVIALRGTPPGENPAFLWENHAWPVDVLPPEIADFDATYDLSNVTEGYVVHLTIVAYHFHEYVIRFKTNAVEPFIPGVPSMEDGVVRNSIHGFISDAEFVLEVKGPGGTQISEPLFLPIP